MSKVFAQITPQYKDKIAAVEADVNAEKNFSLVDKYKIMTIPTSVLIDAQGNVVEKFSGYYPAEEMQSKLNRLLE